MAIVDIVILLCFVPAIVQGITKGFVKQIVGIVAIFAAVWAAFHFSNLVSEWISGFANVDGKLLHVVSFTIIVILTSLVMVLLGSLLTSLLKGLSLGTLNRVLGVLFSLMKTTLVISLFVIVLDSVNGTFHIIDQNVLDSATLFNAFKKVALTVFPYLKELIAGAANV